MHIYNNFLPKQKIYVFKYAMTRKNNKLTPIISFKPEQIYHFTNHFFLDFKRLSNYQPRSPFHRKRSHRNRRTFTGSQE